MVDQQINQQGTGQEVEHDGGDHHVAATIGLQISRYRCPGNTENNAGHQHHGQHHPRRLAVRQPQRHQPGTQTTHDGLPLTTNVEQPAVKSNRHSQAREDEGRGVVQRVTQTTRRTKCAANQDSQYVNRVLTNQRHHGSGSQQRHQQVDNRQHTQFDPTRHRLVRTHAALPNMSMPNLDSVHWSIGNSPVTRPWFNTMTRSDSARISSSSLDTTSTAHPASRMARNCE